MDHEPFFDRLLKSRAAEARQWLRESMRGLGELTPDESVSLVERLYALGAMEVVAVEIETIPGTSDETANHLVVRLPEEQEFRGQLFKFERERAKSAGFDGETDRGQGYLFFKLS